MKNIVAEENLFNAVKAAVELSKRDGPDAPSTNNPTTSTQGGPGPSSSRGSSPSSSASSTSSASSAKADPKLAASTKARNLLKLKHIEPASVNRYGLYRPELGIYRAMNRQNPYLSVPRPPQQAEEVKTRISEVHARKLLRKWLLGEWAPSLDRRDIQPMLKGFDEGTLGPNARFWNE
jgi:hypothetical protein